MFKKTNYLPHKIYCMLLTLALLGMAALVQANTLTANVDRNTIALNETLTLIVTADEQTKDSPDFSALKNDFEVLSTSRSSSFRIINGNAASSTDWHITLAPKHAGTLLIPSFNVDNAVSDAIEINVVEQNQNQANSNEQVRVVVEANKTSAYVQEQILIKVKLITEISLAQAEMQPLELKNALVVNTDQTQYQTTIDGKPHLIVETSFAVFPQESGEIIIPSLSYNVSINDARNGWGDPFNRGRNNILRLRSAEKRIQVNPVPTHYDTKNWQPANQLTISESWSSSLDQLKVGEPVTRTITINADGLTGGQIAPLANTSIDGLTFYPDQAQTKDNKSAQGVQGSRVETTAIVPNRGGDFTLPEINVNWWDNNSQTMRTATLPAKTIHVAGDAALQPLANLQNIPTNNSNTGNAAITAPTPSLQATDAASPWLWATSILFALLSLGLATYAWQLKSRLTQWQTSQALSENEVAQREKDVWNVLKHAAGNRDAPALRKAVLNWAQYQWPAQHIHTLDEIAKLAANEKLTTALKQLDELLYSNHLSTEWNPDTLLSLLKESQKESKNKTAAPELKPLYASR
ncbi:MAG: BatD family protein [Pseudomonadota bacterium]